MDVLISGGTGAMDTHLVDYLSANTDATVTVTSRKKRADYGNIKYIREV